jgi:hypothetical protein
MSLIFLEIPAQGSNAILALLLGLALLLAKSHLIS